MEQVLLEKLTGSQFVKKFPTFYRTQRFIAAFLFNKTNRYTNFPNVFLSINSTCFGQFLCPSSEVFHSTSGTGVCHAGA
jgi:hypothetical protein